MRRFSVSVLIGLFVAATPVSVLAQQSQNPGMGGPGMGGPGGMGMGGGNPDQGSGMNQQGMMGQYGYRGIDRDGDGLVSQEEVREHQRLLERMQADWEQADRNGDGQVDVGEFAAFEQTYRNRQEE
ncbi:EF-hand domain-containing protein [Thiohalomonas denitrificans]|nr:EF-hand domain-containing protein [Thiohalomonas denitrificans]